MFQYYVILTTVVTTKLDGTVFGGLSSSAERLMARLTEPLFLSQ